MATPEQKTEAATPRRRQEARRQGMTLQAPVVSRAVAVAGVLIIVLAVGATGQGLYMSLLTYLGSPATTQTPTVAWAAAVMRGVVSTTLLQMAPVLAIGLLLAIFGPVVQHGISAQPLRFDFSRLDPVKGFSRLFSRRSFLETMLSAITLALIVPVAAVIWWNLLHQLEVGIYPLPALLSIAYRGGTGLLYALVALSLLAGAVDYFLARQQFEQDIRMTRQEIREEQRRSEGDPLVRARLRSLQRRTAQMRMLARVKEADVVVTNPTHFAVALKYEQNKMNAPQVVAKGRGFVAERIKQEAAEHGVPIVPNAPLAQALHRSVEVGAPIPPELFRAVAEVLAFVYRQKGSAPGGGSA
ncbi:MAG: EscU/YscU/HrcU family type III secretion system export apparatus switch protein [Thermaerobacter sp.]|nr:EscU/YscU/HrcU family type III secretion system export apparatus switch protein [Thermaerobacter sp.]